MSKHFIKMIHLSMWTFTLSITLLSAAKGKHGRPRAAVDSSRTDSGCSLLIVVSVRGLTGHLKTRSPCSGTVWAVRRRGLAEGSTSLGWALRFQTILRHSQFALCFPLWFDV